jgi:hypothetical protein
MRLQKSSKDAATIGAATMNDLKQKYDAFTVAVLRQALNEVVTDRRFLIRKSITPLRWRSIFFSRLLPGYATSTV